MKLRFKKLDKLVDELFENFREHAPHQTVDDFRDNFINFQNNIKQYHAYFKVVVSMQDLRDKLFRDNKYLYSQFEDVQIKIGDLIEQSNEIFTQIEFFYKIIIAKKQFSKKEKQNFKKAKKSKNVIMKRQKIYEEIFEKEDEEIIKIQKQFKEYLERMEADKNKDFEEESYDENEESESEQDLQNNKKQKKLMNESSQKKEEFEYKITKEEMEILDDFAKFDEQLVFQKG